MTKHEQVVIEYIIVIFVIIIERELRLISL